MGNDALSSDTTPPDVDYGAVQASPEFQKLRKAHRSFVFPVLAACLVWYLAYVLLASYAHDFMSTPVWGSVNVAMILGLAQVVTTFAVTTWYVAYANRNLDPKAEQIRSEIEGGDFGSAGAATGAAAGSTASTTASTTAEEASR